jgi:GTP-binding protein LepA
MKQRLIRNFSIVAHVDHGKSTLADRILEFTGSVSDRDKKAQMLDTMDLERERGITIKAQSACFTYNAQDGQEYLLNLVDTPGHVDFAYEVSRSLVACEGALLLVDAAQGIEAQTIANLYKAMDCDVEIIPVINKIDLPGADPDGVIQQLNDLMGCEPEEVVLASAKTGEGTQEVLEAIVSRIPPPQGSADEPLQALVIDSIHDTYRGVVAYFRIFKGAVKEGDIIHLMANKEEFEVSEVGVFTPALKRTGSLSSGEVGYLMANIRRLEDLNVGDTITLAKNKTSEPLPGYQPAKSMVYCGLYTTDAHEFETLRECLEKLHLNDSSLHFEPESSAALGFGFRCGFLGMLHMEVVQERLERDYDLSLITTAPGVIYKVKNKKGEVREVDNPGMMPPPEQIETIYEPYIHGTIITPNEYVGAIMKLAMDRRGIEGVSEYLTGGRVILKYDFPLTEVILDFHDKIKTISRGYASFDYELADFRPGKIVRLDVLVNKEPVDALTVMVHRDKAQEKGRSLVTKIRKAIPRQQYDVAIQAALGGQIVARETVKAMRKNVTAKCYGGDISRKRKLIERQKEGKKRMKQVGSVTIPQEAFMAILDL